MNTTYARRMREQWKDPAYRAKMLEALARGRETFTTSPQLIAETAERSRRQRQGKVQRGSR